MILNSVAGPSATEENTPGFRRLKRCPCSFCDHASFVLGNGSHDLHRECVGVRKVDGNEIDSGLLKASDKSDGASQPIKLGYNQGGSVNSAVAKRSIQRGPVSPAPTLDLLMGGDYSSASDKTVDSIVLGIESQTALTLPLG
jgi:hypothetical protein